MDEELRFQRIRILALLLAAGMLVLVGRLAFLQLVEGESLAALAHRQSLQNISVPAPRGSIVDANGVALATTRPAFTTSLVYTGETFSDAQVQELAEIHNLSEDMVRSTIQELNRFPSRPALIKMDLSEKEASAVAAVLHRFPGLLLDVTPIRIYPHGSLAAHILGYVGNINETDLKRWDGYGFSGQDIVGRTGIERLFTFPDYLQGEKGRRVLTVDARGRPSGEPVEEPPVPGNSVRLTIDAKLQAAAEEGLATTLERLRNGVDPMLRRRTNLSIPAAPGEEGVELQVDREYPDARAGAVVALDVQTGAILAMASYPSFDPNDFALRAYYRSGDPRYGELDARVHSITAGVQARQDAPLLFRALEATYSPGSTYKPVTALAGLDAGRSVDSVFCTGSHPTAFPGLAPRRDWLPSGHGRVNLVQAMAVSCNIYFYTQGEELGWSDNPTREAAQAFGFGSRTGLMAGPQPDPEYRLWPWNEHAGYIHSRDTGEWFPGDIYSVAIGQISRTTPLQLANMMAAIANGGRLYEPYLVDAVLAPDGTVLETFSGGEGQDIGFSSSDMARVQEGLVRATRPGGTGYGRFIDWEVHGFPVRAATKTGTAEVTGRSPHGVFIAYAPADKPRIAVAAIVEHGGGGYLAGGPVVRAVLDAYFDYEGFLAEAAGDEVEPSEHPPDAWRLP